MHERVNRLGGALLELDVRPEERVAFLLPDSPAWAYAFFGAMKIGAVAVPLNTLLAPKDYEYLLNDCRGGCWWFTSRFWVRFAPFAIGCGI